MGERDNKGRFTSGNQGKPKGAKNKKHALVKALAYYLIDGGYSKFKNEFDKLEGKDFVDSFIGLAKLSIDEDTEKQAVKEAINSLNFKTK
jgi:hypothetical protein